LAEDFPLCPFGARFLRIGREHRSSESVPSLFISTSFLVRKNRLSILSGTFSDAKHKAPRNRLFADGNSKCLKEMYGYQIMLIFVK